MSKYKQKIDTFEKISIYFQQSRFVSKLLCPSVSCLSLFLMPALICNKFYPSVIAAPFHSKGCPQFVIPVITWNNTCPNFVLTDLPKLVTKTKLPQFVKYVYSNM